MPAGPLFKDASSRRKFLERLSRAGVSTGARAWGQHLATRSGNNGHYCYGNQERFAAEMGRSVDSIQRYLKTQVVTHPGMSYQVALHDFVPNGVPSHWAPMAIEGIEKNIRSGTPQPISAPTYSRFRRFASRNRPT